MKLVVNEKHWWAGSSAENSGKTKVYEFDEKYLEYGKTLLISYSFTDKRTDVADIELGIKITDKKDNKLSITILSKFLSMKPKNISVDGKNFVLNKIKQPQENEELTMETMKNILFLSTNSCDAGEEYTIYLVD